MFKAFEIDNLNIDKPMFFRALAKYFPDATTLYVGGDAIAEDVKACYLDYSNDWGFDVTDLQVWTYKCLFSNKLMEELAVLSESHDFLELLERVSLHRKDERLLQWNDVLHDTKIWVSDLVSEKMA